MKVILSEKIARILKARAQLERALNLKITNRGKEVTIVGKAEDEYVGEKVIDALNFGFPFTHAIEIVEQDFLYEVLNIKEYAVSKDLGRIRGRIIGAKGKALKVLSDLTGCHLEIKDNEIGIIGPPESIERAQEAVVLIIKGSTHSNVYSHLEKSRPEEVVDLGLKNPKERL